MCSWRWRRLPGLMAIIVVLTGFSPARADDTARYRVSIALNWTETRFPADYPANAHWSRLIAMAHAPRYRLFADGETASSGLALLAANGRVTVLEAELDEARRRGRAADHIVIPGLKTGAGRLSFEVTLTDAAPVLSFATMLAPSPDWFTGARIDARDDSGGFVAQAERPLWVWDAGADSGPRFTSPNAETQPRQSVRLSTHPAFLQAQGLAPIGSVRIDRLAAAP